jgi:uncharacterized protein (DUF1697 family)
MPSRTVSYVWKWAEEWLDVARYVALARGINVGRAKRVAMSDLREILEALGYAEVRTLLNSGNVVFSGRAGRPSTAARRIGEALLSRLGVSSRIHVLTADDFSKAVSENVLVERSNDPARLLVGFCDNPSRLAELKALERQNWHPDALAVGRAAAYLWCPSGLLASRLAQAVGGLLGDSWTTRNWATVLKIQAELDRPPRPTRA